LVTKAVPSTPRHRDSHCGQPHQVRPEGLRRRLRHPRVRLGRLTNPFYFDARGFLHSDKIKVARETLPASSCEFEGAPIGVLNHFTDGCQDPFHTLEERGVGVQLAVAQRGAEVWQYSSIWRGQWHAYGASHHFVGIENADAPGAGCDFTVKQLDVLAALNAAILVAIYRHKHLYVPTLRSPGVAFRPGIKCHTDGLEKPSAWDRNGHWDAPWRATGDPISQWISSGEHRALDRSPWSSKQFVARVHQYRGQ
jgi:N-acetylmuramoyl-L-alanine amidase